MNREGREEVEVGQPDEKLQSKGENREGGHSLLNVSEAHLQKSCKTTPKSSLHSAPSPWISQTTRISGDI